MRGFKTLAVLTCTLFMTTLVGFGEEVTTPIPTITPIEVVQIVTPSPMPEDMTEVILDIAEVQIDYRVYITFTSNSSLTIGDTMRLHCNLEGFSRNTVHIQWEINNGNGWKDIDGATDEDYSCEITEDNSSAEWRVTVTD